MLLTDIVTYYQKGQTIVQIAKHFGVSENKVMKCLITANIYPTPTALKIKVMREQAMTESEIAAQLGISVKSMDKYQPYTKVIYNENPSENAQRIKKCRSKKKSKEENKQIS